MTNIARFNLLWLCHAMTAPALTEELYYYDGQSKKFFSTKPSLADSGRLEVFDMVDLIIPAPLSGELLKRVTDMDAESSEIVEIPRLNVQDKAAVQLLFLSKFPGVIHEEALRLAAEKQDDVYGFVMDKVLAHMDSLSPMEPHWEDFKLKTIQYYLEKFTGLVGITLKML
jgi:hypothetical protein